MRPTIKDVARIAEVSTATVSKVVNNDPTISEATRQRVFKVIEELNYIPNRQARSLASKKTNRIAFTGLVNQNSAFDNPHFFEIMSGTFFQLNKKGYTLEFFGIKSENEDSNIIKLMQSNSIDGIIIHVSALTKQLAKYLTLNDFPYVVIGKPDFPNSVCWVDNDHQLAGEVATRALYLNGIKKIAFLAGKAEDNISNLRLEGFKKELKVHNLGLDEQIILYTDSTYKTAYNQTIALMATNRPEAIICANNKINLGCINALKDLKVNIPEDVSIITFDDYPYAALTSPATTSVNIDVYDLGKQAILFLISKLKDPNYFFQTHVTRPLIVQRETTRNTH